MSRIGRAILAANAFAGGWNIVLLLSGHSDMPFATGAVGVANIVVTAIMVSIPNRVLQSD